MYNTVIFKKYHQVSISSTFFTQNFCMNVFFGSFSLVTCKQKKLPKRLMYIKFAHKTLMKLTTGVNFINILLAPFLYESLYDTFLQLHVSGKRLHKALLYEKCAHKMLMKLTTEGKITLNQCSPLFWICCLLQIISQIWRA